MLSSEVKPTPSPGLKYREEERKKAKQKEKKQDKKILNLSSVIEDFLLLSLVTLLSFFQESEPKVTSKNLLQLPLCPAQSDSD